MILLALGALLVASPVMASGKSAYQHYLKALLNANQGQYPDALKEYEAALALDPQSSTMYEQAAQLALEMGNTDRALGFAARFAEISPENAQAQYLLGQVNWARGNADAAKAAFEKALALKPGHAQALYALGSLLGNKSPDEAKKYLADFVKENPDESSEALYQIGLLETRGGNDAEAEKRFKEAVAADADNMQARHALAQLYEGRRDTEAALIAYTGILDRDPRNVVLMNHIGEIFVLKDDNAKAKEFFLRAKDIVPSHPATCLWLALMAEEANDYAEAAKQVKDSAALGEDAALSLRLSYYLTQGGDLKQAVSVLETAHGHWPDNEEVSYFLGLGYDDLKQPAKAAALMEKVVKAHPDHRDALFQLGSIREKLGDIKSSEEAFRALIKAHPNDAAALNYLGYALADRGLKLDDAEELVKAALRLEPANGAYLDSLGWIEFKRGRYEAALEALKKATAALPTDETVWSHLSLAQEMNGDALGAWLSLKRAQSSAPEDAALAKKAAALESGLTPEQLGERQLAFAKALHGRFAVFGGPCAIEGSLGGKPFKFNGLLHYRAPRELSMDVLGPMFVPLFRAQLGSDESFVMDPLELDGVKPETAREAVYGALKVLRRWLDGSVFDLRPGTLKRPWRKPARVEAAGAILTLDKAEAAVESLQDSGGLELLLGDYAWVAGRRVPATLTVQTRGFELKFRFARPEVRFE